MKIAGVEQVVFNRLFALTAQDGVTPYGYQSAPHQFSTDFIGEHSASGAPILINDITYSTNDDIAGPGYNNGFDPIAKVVHPKPMFVPHDNIIGTPYYYEETESTTVSWWDLITNGLSPAVYQWQDLTLGYQHMRYEDPNGSSFSMEGAGTVPCQAFTCFLKFQCAPDLYDGFSFASICFRVSGSNRSAFRWCAITLNTARNPEFYYNDFNDSNGFPIDGYWVLADNPKTTGNIADLINGGNLGPYDSAGYSDIDGFPESLMHQVNVKFAGGQILMSVDNHALTPFVWPHDLLDSHGNPDWCFDYFQIMGGNVYVLDWSVHLTKWATQSKLLSSMQIGFSPTNDQLNSLSFRIHCLPRLNTSSSLFDSNNPGFRPGGTTVSASAAAYADGLLRYLLTMSGTQTGTYLGDSYADYAPMVYAVTAEFPGSETSVGGDVITLGQYGEPPMPQEIQIYHQFDINTLTYKSTAALTFCNFNGFWTNGDNYGWLDLLGQYGVQINLGSAGYNESGNQVMGGGTSRQFTGIANVDFTDVWPGGGRDTVTINCEDFWLKLQVPFWQFRFYDGMNLYYVMYEIAQLCGVTEAQIGFMNYVPDDPYSNSSGISGDNQIFLPVGPSGSATTRFSPGMIAKDAMLKIAYSEGMSLYFDVYGKLQMQPWLLTSGWNQGSGTVLYSGYAGAATTDLSTCGLDQGADEVFQGEFKGNLRDTRNAVMIMGPNIIGSQYDVKSAYVQDNNSISDDGWEGTPTANFIGWRNPLIWTDNMFADSTFAAQAMSAMFNFLRIPTREVSFSAWQKPGTPVYPGMLIRVLYTRSGATGFTMFCTSVRHIHIKGQVPTCQVTGRIIPSGFSS